MLHYNVWYRSLARDAGARQQRWREFLLGDDPKEAEVRRGDWIEGGEAYRRQMQQAEASRTPTRPAERQALQAAGMSAPRT